MILRILIFLHRWVGVAIGAVFLLWFLSGIGMMYWTFPGASAGDRLDRSPNLDPSKITLSPAEAAEKAGLDPSPTQIRLNSFDGRPVYRISAGAEAAVVVDAAAVAVRSCMPTRENCRQKSRRKCAIGLRAHGPACLWLRRR